MSSRLDQALTRARVDDDQLDTPPVRAAINLLGTAIVDPAVDGPRSTTSRRTKIGAVIGAAALTLGVGIPAAADYVSLNSGQKDTDGSEMWRLDSPDAPVAFTKLSRDYPLAPGYSAVKMGQDLAGSVPSAESELMFRSDVFLYSMCTWERSWLTARTSGDVAARKRSSAALLDFDRRANQPVKLFTRGNVRSFVGELQQSVRADQPYLVERDVRINCDYRSMR